MTLGIDAREQGEGEKRVNSRRPSSTAQSNRPYLRIGTPTPSQASRDRQNLSVTHTSSFSNKAQRLTMQGFNKVKNIHGENDIE